jgi:hypothetical protein
MLRPNRLKHSLIEISNNKSIFTSPFPSSSFSLFRKKEKKKNFSLLLKKIIKPITITASITSISFPLLSLE